MKRLTKLVSWTLAGILALYSIWALDNARAQTSTTTTKYSGRNPGQVMGTGTVRWRLATICADTDSSMIASSLINSWNDSNREVPSIVWIAMKVDSAAGGGAGSRLHLRIYRHYLSTETAGSGLSQLVGRATAAAIDTLNLAVGTGTAATTHAVFSTYSAVSAPVAEHAIAPYFSIKIDKEGVKKFTAGYVDVYWTAVR